MYKPQCKLLNVTLPYRSPIMIEEIDYIDYDPSMIDQDNEDSDIDNLSKHNYKDHKDDKHYISLWNSHYPGNMKQTLLFEGGLLGEFVDLPNTTVQLYAAVNTYNGADRLIFICIHNDSLGMKRVGVFKSTDNMLRYLSACENCKHITKDLFDRLVGSSLVYGIKFPDNLD